MRFDEVDEINTAAISWRSALADIAAVEASGSGSWDFEFSATQTLRISRDELLAMLNARRANAERMLARHNIQVTMPTCEPAVGRPPAGSDPAAA